MADIPGELRFLKTHEWARIEEDGRVRVGISEHAQEQLGDLVYIELPEIGAQVEAETPAAVVESVKAASDVCAPVTGTVVAVNETLSGQPELINQDPYDQGWIFLLEADDKAELDALLDARAYANLLEQDAE